MNRYFNFKNNFKKILTIQSISFQKSFYNCWSCKKPLNDLEIKSQFCPCDKNVILPVNNKMNYYEIFNIHTDFNIDKTELTKIFRQKMRKLHPDLFTLKSDVINKYPMFFLVSLF